MKTIIVNKSKDERVDSLLKEIKKIKNEDIQSAMLDVLFGLDLVETRITNRMKRLKIGTKIRIKSDLVLFQKYGDDVVTPSMMRFISVETKIKGDCYCDGNYAIECDEGEFNWTPEMFDVIE